MTQLIYSALPQPRRPIVFVDAKTSVSQCIALMIEENIGALVVRNNEEVIGIISERDVVRSCVHHELNPHKITAADIAYADVSLLELNDPLEKAMETITSTKRRHVLVREANELVAILSIGDLLFYLLEDKTRVIEQLENYIHTY